MFRSLTPFVAAVVIALAFSTALGAPIQWTHNSDAPARSYRTAMVDGDHAGNVLVAGDVTSNPQTGNPDYYLCAAKYDGKDGHQLWEYIAPPQPPSRDIGRAVRADSANDVFVAGLHDSRLHLVKLSGNDGHVLWEAPPFDFFNTSDAVAMEVDAHNDLIVLGSRTTISSGNGNTYTYFSIAKYSGANGHVIWQQSSPTTAEPRDLALDPSGNAIIAAGTRPPDSPTSGRFEFTVAEYDAADGHLRWEHRHPDPENGGARLVASDPAGNAIAFGTIGTGLDEFSEKLAAADGHSLWSQRIVGFPRRDIVDLAVDQNGDAVIAGHDANGLDPWVFYAAKFSGNDGLPLWERRTNITSSNYQGADARAVELDAAGNAYVCGHIDFKAPFTSQEYTVVYAAADGATLWEQRYESTPTQSVFPAPHPLALLSDGDLAVFGSIGTFSQTQFFTIKYSTASQLLNISTRAPIQSGDDALIGGFIVTGSAPKKVLVRALGPSLPVAGALQDPVLELHKSDGTVVTNDNWRDSQEIEIAATLPPSNDKESAIIALVPPGAHTAIVRGKNGGTGIGLIEVYDIDAAAASTSANISTRGRVETGDNVMIGGFILRGPQPSTVLVRALGPSLANNGVKSPLQDPTLEIVDANGSGVTNDDWKRNASGTPDPAQQNRIESTGVAPSDDRESALLVTLPLGAYTAVVRGKNGDTGSALIEVYNLERWREPTSFSFENGLEGWAPKATDIDHPPVTWSIAPSTELAIDGTHSAKFELENLNDAGKIWLERAFTVLPNKQYHVRVQFSFGTQDFGDANHFTIIAGVRTTPAVTRNDLTYQDQTGNGEQSNTGYKWLEKTYDFNLPSGPDGTLYIDLGIWGTWETARTYYIDNVRLTITEN